MAQLMLLPLTVSCFSKIKIGFTFLVPAHLGSPGKRAVKRVSVCLSLNRLSSMPLYMEAIREDSHTPGRGMHVMIKTSHKETYVVSGTGFLWPDAHLSYNQWCQNTKGNSKHWCKSVTWHHPFLIHHHSIWKTEMSLNPPLGTVCRTMWSLICFCLPSVSIRNICPRLPSRYFVECL